ncbi:MAG TPA: hypothetical protein VKY85_28580 [Candidatus Angelobacter sp.]|nr:hypothetical protein [Candidatus Angelobacter sp.]
MRLDPQDSSRVDEFDRISFEPPLAILSLAITLQIDERTKAFLAGLEQAKVFLDTCIRELERQGNDTGPNDIRTQWKIAPNMFLPHSAPSSRTALEDTGSQTMTAEQILSEMNWYETEFAGILSRFNRNRDGVWIGEGDDPIFRQYVREIIDLFNDVFGNNVYSQQIAEEFNHGISNYTSSPSYKCVENILSIVRAVLTRLNRNPRLLEGQEAQENDAGQQRVDAVLGICDRFHEVARQLLHRRENRSTLEIKDEYDVQDLLHALLRIHFEDVRTEEWTPSYGGGSSRMDFLLKEYAIVVEAKMAHRTLNTKEVSEQLIIDAAKYRQHPNCKTLICFVYDPSGLLKNPRGVERDLAKLSGDGLDVICLVMP